MCLPEPFKSIQARMREHPNEPILDSMWRHELDNAIAKEESEKSLGYTERVIALQSFKTSVETHNRHINQQYTRAIFPRFANSPENIRVTIMDMERAGYTLVGYKGTNLGTAESFRCSGLDPRFPSGDISGAARGDGLYTTPSFKRAIEFAQIAVVREAAEGTRPKLKTPPIPEDIGALSPVERRRISTLVDEHREARKVFYESDDCKSNMYFLLFFVRDFFVLRNKETKLQESYSAVFDHDYDYVEGHINGEDDWEIKFNKSIYDRIRFIVVPLSELGTPLPEMPFGREQMLRLLPLVEEQSSEEMADESRPTSELKPLSDGMSPSGQ